MTEKDDITTMTIKKQTKKRLKQARISHIKRTDADITLTDLVEILLREGIKAMGY